LCDCFRIFLRSFRLLFSSSNEFEDGFIATEFFPSLSVLKLSFQKYYSELSGIVLHPISQGWSFHILFQVSKGRISYIYVPISFESRMLCFEDFEFSSQFSKPFSLIQILSQLLSEHRFLSNTYGTWFVGDEVRNYGLRSFENFIKSGSVAVEGKRLNLSYM
jgi:hypothetical protein